MIIRRDKIKAMKTRKMNNKQNVTTGSKEIYVAPIAEIMMVELDQSILDAQVSVTFDDGIGQGDNIFG